MDEHAIIGRRDTRGLYHGWLVVAAAFLVAMYGFGLGFYGPGIYLVALNAHHGWSTAELSPAMKDKGRYVEIPAADYPPIEQACVALKSSKQKDAAKAFINYVKTPAAAELFRSYGFAVAGRK